jgi:hypothetical protein
MHVHPSPAPPRWRWLFLLPALGCLACSGGGGLNPVQGTVLYKDQPLKSAVVTFHPKGGADMKTVLPVGLTREDGTFTVTTGSKEGAPAGEYDVTLICSEEVSPKSKKAISTEALPETRDRFQGAYANPATSKLHVEIKKGVNQLEPFQLK